MPALDIWMNGQFVGQWERTDRGLDRLHYDPAWVHADFGRPLSLSLPFSAASPKQPLSGPTVSAYFANLIPDNDAILDRLRLRFAAKSIRPFDLLAAVGRDCVGALQLVPAGDEPGDHRRVDGEPLDEAGVARLLRAATTSAPRAARHDDDAFRLSIAGAQEKTALLKHDGQWMVPRGATPSSHIFKLPLGLVANVRADLSTSVEIEWLCMRICREVGLPTANVEVGRFEDLRVLIVERFDRRFDSAARHWLRLPQEDMCQAFGLPPDRKYEVDGGPGIARIMDLLAGSSRAQLDRENFYRAQMLYWLLGAPDGHAKNFSVFIEPRGRFRMTPLYDVLSSYPIQGRGAHQLDPLNINLAMAVVGKNRHYRIADVHRWHWAAMAASLGLGSLFEPMVESFTTDLPKAFDAVASELPDDFPPEIFEQVRDGSLRSLAKLEREPSVRGTAATH